MHKHLDVVYFIYRALEVKTFFVDDILHCKAHSHWSSIATTTTYLQ